MVGNGSSSRTQLPPTRPRQLRIACGGTSWPSSAPGIGPRAVQTSTPPGQNTVGFLEDVACRKRHNSVESLRRSFVKAPAQIPVEKVRAATAEWPERLKACVEAEGGHFE